MYEIIKNLVDSQFTKSSFSSNFFEKDDLINDMYLYLAEVEEELSEKDILSLLKKKYFNYFEIYDIEDKKSFDKYERGVDAVKEFSQVSGNNSIYEYFENIIWKNNKECPTCKSKEVYPSNKSDREHDCRNCGTSFSFSKDTNLKGFNLKALKNILAVCKLIDNGTICFREIQDKTGTSKAEIKSAYYKNIPNMINNEELIKKTTLLPIKEDKPLIKTEYDHQTIAINKALEYYKDNDRGKIIHPCGSGKTYTAIKITEKLNLERVVVVIPSRTLLKQQIETFLPYFEDYKFYAFGSFNKFDSKRVRILADTVEKQKSQIASISKYEKVIVFTTLKSFSTMEDSFKDGFFDFAIFDEAHRVAGEEYKSFLKVVNFKTYKKALFLTATEKNYIQDGAVGMNNKVFGDNISKIYVKEMIDADVICDYNIVNIAFEDQTVEKLLKENSEFFLNVKVKLPVKTRILISALSLIKCLQKYPLKKVITYHSSIEECILFSSVFKMFAEKYKIDVECYNLHSKQSQHNFQYNLYNFIRSESAVISSVNCFQEGIDVVDVDAILYGYPKKSKIDIPQSIGRCIRKSPNKEKGYVIIPDQIGNSDTYRKLTQVLRAMETIDPRIEDFRINGKKSSYSENLLFEYFEPKAEVDFNSDVFFTKLEVHLQGKNFLSFEEAMKIVYENNITTGRHYKDWVGENTSLNLPKYPHEVYKDWVNWAHFLSKNEGAKKGYKNYEEASQWAKAKGIRNSKEFKEAEKPYDIPSTPDKTYKLTNEWQGWFHFLSSGKQTNGFLNYEEAKNLVKNMPVKSCTEWIEYIKENSNIIEGKIPKWPASYYKEHWKGWADFLGKKTRGKTYSSYKEASEWAAKIGIKSKNEYCRYKSRPEGIPQDAIKAYKEEWISWKDFLQRK